MAWFGRLVKVLGLEARARTKYINLQGAHDFVHLRTVVEETATHYHIRTTEAPLGMLVPYSDEWLPKNDPRIFRVFSW